MEGHPKEANNGSNPGQSAKMNSFSIIRVNRLRRAAERAREVLWPRDRPTDSFTSGWFRSSVDPEKLLGVFKALRLKEGFGLRAYEFRGDMGGNGVIWAVPVDAPVLEPDECPKLEGVFLGDPKPPGAVELMSVIEGDGSPWSYFSASILAREAVEFGAVWHGRSWSSHTILGKPPWETAKLVALAPPEVGIQPEEMWEWQGAVPDTWLPTYKERGETKEITLHSYTAYLREGIYCQTDTYQPGSYDFETKVEVVALGGQGYIH
jgi:hypothetical protein